MDEKHHLTRSIFVKISSFGKGFEYGVPLIPTVVAPVFAGGLATPSVTPNIGRGAKFVNPITIRFSQSSVNGTSEISASMKAKGWSGSPIDVIRMGDGKLTTIDNTRVLAASRAGIKVKANLRNANDKLPFEMIERFTTKQGVPSTWGDAVRLRIGKQSAGWRKNGSPNGSWFTGSKD